MGVGWWLDRSRLEEKASELRWENVRLQLLTTPIDA